MTDSPQREVNAAKRLGVKVLRVPSAPPAPKGVSDGESSHLPRRITDRGHVIEWAKRPFAKNMPLGTHQFLADLASDGCTWETVRGRCVHDRDAAAVAQTWIDAGLGWVRVRPTLVARTADPADQLVALSADQLQRIMSGRRLQGEWLPESARPIHMTLRELAALLPASGCEATPKTQRSKPPHRPNQNNQLTLDMEETS